MNPQHNLTLEEIQQSEWYQTRPEVIQKAIIAYPPIQLYKLKSSGKQCLIVAFDEPESGLLEDVTCMVQKTGVGGPMAEMGLGVLDRNKVFGLKLEDLEVWKDTKKILFLDDCNMFEGANPRAWLVEVDVNLTVEQIHAQENTQIGAMRSGGNWKKAMETGNFLYTELKSGKKSDFIESDYDEIYKVISGNY